VHRPTAIKVIYELVEVANIESVNKDFWPAQHKLKADSALQNISTADRPVAVAAIYNLYSHLKIEFLKLFLA